MRHIYIVVLPTTPAKQHLYLAVVAIIIIILVSRQVNHGGL